MLPAHTDHAECYTLFEFWTTENLNVNRQFLELDSFYHCKFCVGNVDLTRYGNGNNYTSSFSTSSFIASRWEHLNHASQKQC